MTIYEDIVFAPIDRDLQLDRLAGGNETEVYWTDDRRHVVKIKHDLGGDVPGALALARAMRAAAAHFADCLGAEHSIPSYYLVARDGGGRAQVLIIQPFVGGARPLDSIDYAALTPAQRRHIAAQLADIIRRSNEFYRTTGTMPDLYGRTSASQDDRRRQRSLAMLPQRLWSFIVQRNLLRSHNLLLTNEPEPRIVLIDYDPVRQGRLYRLAYYTVRRVLLWRDLLLIGWMRRGGQVAR